MDENKCGKSKLVCKIMASMLALGLAWFYLAHHEHLVWPGKCIGVNMKIENGEIKSAQLQGGMLAVTAGFANPQVTKVIVYDYCNGKVLSSVESSK